MPITPDLTHLLETEMDRKEFLAYLGAAALTIFGVSALLTALTGPLERTSHAKQQSSGYGGGTYGGKA